MSSQKGPNGRITKSFTGCSRCKEKKKKCDESPPSCLACARAGEKCPGYIQQLKWSRKHERFGQPTDYGRGARRKKAARPPPTNETNEQDIAQSTPSNSRHSGFEDLQGTDLPTGPHRNALDLMFSEWLNAEFLPRDDLPLLGLNLPLGQGTSEPGTGLIGSGMHWSSLNDFEENRVPSDLYQSLQVPPYPCDCSSEACDVQSGEDTPDQDQNVSFLASGRHNNSTVLETFYRMSQPTPTARFSAEHLVKHYFTDVCALISCFDSQTNPFRTLVAEELARSSTVSLSIQSMSIAHLANHYLYMAPLGMAKRSQAWKLLQSDLRRHRAGQMPLETVLLSLLLLGSSSSWHQPTNLGLPYLYITRTLMQGYFRTVRGAKQQTRMKDEKFFVDALMQWEMLASFLDPFPMGGFPGYGMPKPPVSGDEGRKVPHPWTGVNTELFFALAEVGRVLRRRQKKAPTISDSDDPDSLQANDERWAAELERFLCSVRLPTSDDILDYGDRDTPKSDLIRAAHGHRYVGLLEIYRAFPHLYENRRNTAASLPSLYNRDFNESIDHSGYPTMLDSSLCAISGEVLESLREISISSSACRLLPLIIVSCACQLRFPNQSQLAEQAQDDRNDQVVDARYFVESRMLALSTRYPQRQILQILDIVKEVWDRLDNDQVDNTHWMDVMHERHLQTLLSV